MNRAPLVRWIRTRSELWRRINRPRFVVPAHSHRRARAFHLRKNPFAHNVRISRSRNSAKKFASHAEIKYNARLRAQIRVEHRARGTSIFREPFLQLTALRNSLQPTSLAKCVTRKPR